MAMGMSLRSKDRHFSPARDMLRHHTRPERAYRSIIDSAVAQVFAINLVELSRQSRGRAKVALARQVAMYVAHVACGLSFTEIGSLFDRDRTTVAHACGIVEDRRDDPMFDTVVELLECAVLNMLFFRDKVTKVQTEMRVMLRQQRDWVTNATVPAPKRCLVERKSAARFACSCAW